MTPHSVTQFDGSHYKNVIEAIEPRYEKCKNLKMRDIQIYFFKNFEDIVKPL